MTTETKKEKKKKRKEKSEKTEEWRGGEGGGRRMGEMEVEADEGADRKGLRKEPLAEDCLFLGHQGGKKWPTMDWPASMPG
jgi:hypothetical protein